MKKTLLSLVALAITRLASASDRIPPELVGEWANPGVTFFSNGVIERGGAIYLNANGWAAIIGSPPPIAYTGTATYDPKTLTLRLTIRGDEEVIQRRRLNYDPKAKTLTYRTRDERETYKRRQNHIPKVVIKALQ